MNTLIEQAIVCEKANQFYAAIEYWSKALDVCDSENNGEGNEFGIIAYHMGHAYFHEIGVQRNLEKGCDLFVRSASVGHRGGLGMCYFLELGEFKKDLGRSLELFHQLAIEEKDTIANYMIGSILDFVDHTEKILRTVVGYNATVLFYLKEAASAGHPVAMLKLSFLYDNPVVGPSSVESVKYLKASADTGYAEAQYRYGFILQYENDRTADALEWYRKAMKQNHPSAMFEVASLYEGGHAKLQVACIKKNLDEAKRLDTASVCEFNIKNQCRIAKDFSNGYNRNHSTTSMTNSFEEARRRFCFAAEHGCAEAMFCLAKCYEQGKLGLQVNLHSARSWLEKAALANHPSYTVALDLAECYQNGNGVARDTDQAIYWYSHALSKIELQGGSVHARNADFRFVMDKYNKVMKTLEL